MRQRSKSKNGISSRHIKYNITEVGIPTFKIPKTLLTKLASANAAV